MDNNWGLFKIIRREGKKPAKEPMDVATGSHPVAANAYFKYSLEEAKAKLNGGSILIGYRPDPTSMYIGLDLDHALDEDGYKLPWAAEIIGDYAGPVGVTPSGMGLRILQPRAEGDDQQNSGEANDVGFFANGARGFTVPLDALGEGIYRDDALVKRLLARKGMAKPVAHSKGPDRHWIEDLPDDEQRDMVKEMLLHIPKEMVKEYHAWCDISMALHWLSQRVRWDVEGVWDEWSQNLSGNAFLDAMTRSNYDEDKNKYLWNQFNGGGGISIGTLLHHAKANGFEPKSWQKMANKARSADMAARMEAFGKMKGIGKVQAPTGFSTAALRVVALDRKPPIIENLIAPHLTYLVGDPKAGKSLVAMQMAEAATTGSDLWGCKTSGKVKGLYYAAENGYEETVGRIQYMKLDGDIEWRFKGKNFDELPEDVDELLLMMTAEVEADPAIGIIFLDTLRWMSGPPKKIDGGNAQDQDFARLMPIQDWCLQTGVSVVAVAHTNKAVDGRGGMRSQLASTAGSNLIAGTAESLLTLTRRFDKTTATPLDDGVIQRMGRSFTADNALSVSLDRRTARFGLTSEAQLKMLNILDTAKKNSSRMQIAVTMIEYPDGILKDELRGLVMGRLGVKRQTYAPIIKEMITDGVLIEEEVSGQAWVRMA